MQHILTKLVYIYNFTGLTTVTVPMRKYINRIIQKVDKRGKVLIVIAVNNDKSVIFAFSLCTFCDYFVVLGAYLRERLLQTGYIAFPLLVSVLIRISPCLQPITTLGLQPGRPEVSTEAKAKVNISIPLRQFLA